MAGVPQRLEEDPVVVTWVWTRVELVGALERVWASDDDPSTMDFFCLDRRLSEAAERQGLRVLA
jgi:hypothetical protein